MMALLAALLGDGSLARPSAERYLGTALWHASVETWHTRMRGQIRVFAKKTPAESISGRERASENTQVGSFGVDTFKERRWAINSRREATPSLL
jgi:hypothetical protein